MHRTTTSLSTTALALCGLLAAACGGGGDVVPDADVPDAPPPPTPPEASVSATALDFGAADCGGDAPAAQTVTLTNGGERALAWSATLRFSPWFRVDGVNGGLLDGGDSVELTVVADAVPATAMAGQELRDVLLITHDDPTRGPFELPVQLTARGATIVVTPAVADFGRIPLGAAAPAIPLTITNTGNAPATVALQSPDSGGLATSFTGGPAAVELAPGATLAGAQATFSPSSLTAVRATADLEVTGAVCGAAPAPIELQGQGIAAIALVSPATLDLGATACGTTAPPRTFVVANTGTGLMTWNAARDAGDASRLLVIPDAGVLGPGNSQLVSVYADAIPATADTTAGAFDETLTVTTDAPGDTPHAIAVRQTARGAVLSFGAAEVEMDAPLSLLVAGSLPSSTVTIQNTGNAPATVGLDVDGGEFALVGGDVTVAPGATVLAAVRLVAPRTIGPVEADAAATTTAVTCGPLPTLTLAGEVTAVSATEGPVVETAITGRVRSNRPVAVCARTKSGHVLCWGDGNSGQRGRLPVPTDRVTPTFVTTADGLLDGVVDLASGRDWYCAERADATQWCWGNLGADGTFNKHSFGISDRPPILGIAAQRFEGLTGISGSATLACGLDESLVPRCINVAQRGGALTAQVPSSPAAQFVATAGGGYARLPNGTVLSFGGNRGGERGAEVAPNAPASLVTSLTEVVEIGAGQGGYQRRATHACARKSDGTVWCWGRGDRGRNGNGSDGDHTTPVQVKLDATTPLTEATRLAVGREFACAATPTNVYCWGRADEGQLGIGTLESTKSYATAVSPAVPDVVSMSTTDRFTCATLSSGAVRCWGQAGWTALPGPAAVPAFEPTGEP